MGFWVIWVFFRGLDLFWEEFFPSFPKQVQHHYLLDDEDDYAGSYICIFFVHELHYKILKNAIMTI